MCWNFYCKLHIKLHRIHKDFNDPKWAVWRRWLSVGFLLESPSAEMHWISQTKTFTCFPPLSADEIFVNMWILQFKSDLLAQYKVDKNVNMHLRQLNKTVPLHVVKPASCSKGICFQKYWNLLVKWNPDGMFLFKEITEVDCKKILNSSVFYLPFFFYFPLKSSVICHVHGNIWRLYIVCAGLWLCTLQPCVGRCAWCPRCCAACLFLSRV